MASLNARAVLKSLPAECRGTLVYAGESCECAYTQRTYTTAPSDYGDEKTNGLALWFVSADLSAVPKSYERVSVEGESWAVRAVRKVAFVLVKLELE